MSFIKGSAIAISAIITIPGTPLVWLSNSSLIDPMNKGTQPQTFFAEGIRHMEQEIQRLFQENAAPLNGGLDVEALRPPPRQAEEQTRSQISRSQISGLPEPGTMPSSPSFSTAPVSEQISLSADQQDDMAEIQDALNAQIETILTSDQTNDLKAALEEGRDFRQAIADLNLSDDQHAELQNAFQTAQQQVMDVLTPPQRQQLLQDLRRQMRSPR